VFTFILKLSLSKQSPPEQSLSAKREKLEISEKKRIKNKNIFFIKNFSKNNLISLKESSF